MSRRVDSGALRLIQRALSLAGPGAQTTELEDEYVRQVLDLQQLISAAAPAITDRGMFVIQAQQVHAGAGSISDNIDPYDPAGTFANIPLEVRTGGYDIWVHGWNVNTSSAANTTGAAVSIDVSALSPFISDGVLTGANVMLASWGVFIDVGASNAAQSALIGKTHLLPRTADGLILESQASGVATVNIMGLAEFVSPGMRPATF